MSRQELEAGFLNCGLTHGRGRSVSGVFCFGCLVLLMVFGCSVCGLRCFVLLLCVCFLSRSNWTGSDLLVFPCWVAIVMLPQGDPVYFWVQFGATEGVLVPFVATRKKVLGSHAKSGKIGLLKACQFE